MSDEKKPYIKITSLTKYKHENLEEEWFVIDENLESARALADEIGMPPNRKEQVIYLTQRQYESIPPVD